MAPGMKNHVMAVAVSLGRGSGRSFLNCLSDSADSLVVETVAEPLSNIEILQGMQI